MSTLTDITNALLAAGLDAVEAWDAVTVFVTVDAEDRILAEVWPDGTVTPGTVEGSEAMVARVVAALGGEK